MFVALKVHVQQHPYDDARYKYAVGPVYLAHINDWYHIATSWWDAMPRVHEQYPYLLAEMYALTMSVANLTLPWALVSNFMISDPSTMSSTEAWIWIDNLTIVDDTAATTNNSTTADPTTVVCDGATATELPFITRDNDPTTILLPNILHYCQRYIIGNDDDGGGQQKQVMFSKRKIRHDFFHCISEGEGGNK